MKNLKLLAIAAFAAMALMAFAASWASAEGGMLYNGATTLGVGSKLDFSIPSGSSANLVDTKGNSLDKCSTSTIRGELTKAGSSTVNPTAKLTELTWGSCTFPTKTVALGNLVVDWDFETRGTVKADNETEIPATATEVTINTVLFGSCIFRATFAQALGTLTTFSSGAATFDANAVVYRSLSSPSFCPETAVWTASYTSTEPTNLRVESS